MQAQTTADFARSRRSSLIAAIFLMATSAIGPGFITQTATFTATMGAAFQNTNAQVTYWVSSLKRE